MKSIRADHNGDRGFFVEHFMLDLCGPFQANQTYRAASASTVIRRKTDRDVLAVDVVIPKTTDDFNPKKTAAV